MEGKTTESLLLLVVFAAFLWVANERRGIVKEKMALANDRVKLDEKMAQREVLQSPLFTSQICLPDRLFFNTTFDQRVPEQ